MGKRSSITMPSTATPPSAGDAYLHTAVRAYATSAVDADDGDAPPKGKPGTPDSHWPEYVLIFDTETTADAAQLLNFGCYRFCRWTDDGRLICLEEGIFHGDDLPRRFADGHATLKAYVRDHWATVAPAQSANMPLYSRRAFVDDVLWKAAGGTGARALVTGFNLPFDLSRLAIRWGEARDNRAERGAEELADTGRRRNRKKRRNRFAGGFSFAVWDYRDKRDQGTDARRERSQYRPRVCVKHIDSKRALIGFGGMRAGAGGVRDQGADTPTFFGGHFLDLRTLVFALTDKGHSLASACEAFGIPPDESKKKVETHGVITPEYIAYCRQDVLATQALLEKVREEYDRHPIDLAPTRAYSPASIAKAYLRAMDITPPLERQPDFSRDVLGYAMAAYYGGRAECRIRHTPVPVVYCDFLSMYPTVNTLMGLWRFITAARIEVVDATEEVRAFLAGITLDGCFNPATWRDFTFLAEIEPDGDILPVRAAYGGNEGGWNIGVNPFHAATPHWYAGPDLIASTLLTGKPPRVTRAFRLVPMGIQPDLRPVMLRRAIPIDPTKDDEDFFRTVIEERKKLGSGDRLDKFLKVLANSGSYGIYAEMNRQELPIGERETVTIHGLDTPFEAKTAAPEEPGVFCFPPLAAIITAAARLMLAMAERCVTDAGGAYAFCDTDSMAIVASETGGLVPCDGGLHRLPDGRKAIRALSWREVDEIVVRFAALNPYDPDVVSGSVLEIEDENFTDVTYENDKKRYGPRHQLWCDGISAKRYALYTIGDEGQPVLRKWSEHGLGHLLDPTKEPDHREVAPDADATEEDDEPALIAAEDAHDARGWMRDVWEALVRETYDLAHPLAWLDRAALTRVTISSPRLMEPFEKNPKRPRDEPLDMRPFNFILSAHIAPFGHPAGVERAHFHLIAPFKTDARQWGKMKWTDVYSGKRYSITTKGGSGPGVARVKTYRDVLTDYRVHRETKSAAPDGSICGRGTRGLLRRRVVRAIGHPAYIGKEANKLEAVQAGLVHSRDDVLNLYPDARHDAWQELVLPVVKEMDAAMLAKATAISPRQIRNVQKGDVAPHTGNQVSLKHAAASFARGRLPQPAPHDDLAALTAYLDMRPAIEPTMRTCSACQQSFVPTSLQQQYCSQRCKKRTARARRSVH